MKSPFTVYMTVLWKTLTFPDINKDNDGFLFLLQITAASVTELEYLLQHSDYCIMPNV